MTADQSHGCSVLCPSSIVSLRRSVSWAIAAPPGGALPCAPPWRPGLSALNQLGGMRATSAYLQAQTSSILAHHRCRMSSFVRELSRVVVGEFVFVAERPTRVMYPGLWFAPEPAKRPAETGLLISWIELAHEHLRSPGHLCPYRNLQGVLRATARAQANGNLKTAMS